MAGDRVTELRVAGLRVLDDVRLPLRGLTVLIGENGTGKSSLVEAFELLRKAASPGDFIGQSLARHGGLSWLLRQGAQALRLGCRIEGDGQPPMDHAIEIAREGPSVLVARETLDVWADEGKAEPLHAIRRDRAACEVFDRGQGTLRKVVVPGGSLALSSLVMLNQRDIGRALEAIGGGSVHVPFDVRPLWVAREREGLAPMRLSGVLQKADDLAPFGDNLADCYYRLRQTPEVWARTLESLRGGLGPDVEDITVPATARPGQVEMRVHLRGLSEPLQAGTLSEGQLAYLALVALVELSELGHERSFVVLDEPELHLHPELLRLSVALLERLAQTCPVVVATHSDRLLDALSEPAQSVVLCELDERHATRLLRPDAGELARWLERYGGVGRLREEGYERQIADRPISP